MSNPAESWPRDALPKGTDLHGYRLDRVIGRGGFGITYRAVDGIDQVFAVKECFPRQFSMRQGLEVFPADVDEAEPYQDCLSRFTREAKALRQLSTIGAAGDGVVKVMTFFQTNGTAYIVMEYLPGQSLDAAIKENAKGMPEEQIRFILPRLLHAVGCVHDAGLLHRDIKPANILLREDGRPVLIDFGAARGAAGGQTVTYTQIFSEGYAPIEQFAGAQQGPFSDIYALGASFYRAIGGTAIDSFTRHQAVLRGTRDPQIPAIEVGEGRYSTTLLRTIDRAMTVAPEQRPQSVRALLEMLDEADDSADVTMLVTKADSAPTMMAPRRTSAPPPPEPALVAIPVARPLPAPRRFPWWLVVAALVVVAAAIAAVVLFLPANQVGRDRAVAAQIEAKRALDRAKSTVSGLGLTAGNFLERATASMTQADAEFAKSDFAHAADDFANVPGLADAATQTFLEQQEAAQAALSQTKMAAGDLAGAQAALMTAKKIKQAEAPSADTPPATPATPAPDVAGASAAAKAALDRADAAVTDLGLTPGNFLADATAMMAKANSELIQDDLASAARDFGQVPALANAATRSFLDQQEAAQAKLSQTKMTAGDLDGAQGALRFAKRIKQAEAAFP